VEGLASHPHARNDMLAQRVGCQQRYCTSYYIVHLKVSQNYDSKYNKLPSLTSNNSEECYVYVGYDGREGEEFRQTPRKEVLPDRDNDVVLRDKSEVSNVHCST